MPSIQFKAKTKTLEKPKGFSIISIWWAMGDSNPRLLPCDDSTLPAELIARFFVFEKHI